MTIRSVVAAVAKRETRQLKKLLGVDVGHASTETETVRTTTRSSDGDTSTRVKTTR